MTDIAEHRCTEGGCPFVGQTTTRSCQCHKSREQMLMERIGELTEELEQQADGCATIIGLMKGQNSAVAASLCAMLHFQEVNARAALTKEPSA